MKHYLLTGGAGFIGTNLCKYLLNMGDKVTVWDDLSTGRRENVPEGVNFMSVDIISYVPFTSKFDAIFNLACPASPPKYQKDPVQTMLTCVIGMKNMLDLATKLNIPILQASTSEIYGDPNIKVQSETYCGNVNCIGPRSCYDEGKRAAETLCFDYNRQYKTKIKVVRIFNTYGPHMDSKDGRVVSNFITQALSNKPITIYGDGSQTRSLCYIDDLLSGLYKMINTPDEVTGPINLGNNDEISVLDLANLISNMTRSKSIFKLKSLPIHDPKQRCPDISLAKKSLDWKPQITLIDGLNRTIKYFQSSLTIGIIGGGFVGSATALLKCTGVKTIVYDLDPDKCDPSETKFQDLCNVNLIFICLPTPSGPNGQCNTTIVEKVVSQVKNMCDIPIVIRSTVPPGTCERLGVSFMPEFLREKTAHNDFRSTEEWIVGAIDETVKQLITRVIKTAKRYEVIKSSIIRYVHPKEGEMIKYMRNSFLAVKVAFCNEIHDYCTALNIPYDVVRQGFTIDSRIGESHTNVPGHDGQRGFGGHCLPKDTKALAYEFAKHNVTESVLSATIESNEKYIRNY